MLGTPPLQRCFWMLAVTLSWTATGGHQLQAQAPPPVDFDTIQQVVLEIARDETEGRDNLSDGNAMARAFLIDWMQNEPLTPAGTLPGSFEQPFDLGVNLLALYRPAGTAGQAPTVLLGAHYDHLGMTCKTREEAASPVCNGAADNAAGVAAVLAAAQALYGEVQAPFGIAIWDTEEDGLFGSQYFVENPTFDLSEVRIYINLDIIGLNLFRGAEASHFCIGSETGGETLMQDIMDSAQGLPLEVSLLSYALGQGRSDMANFLNSGLPIPIAFFSEGDGSIYHSTADEVQYLNWDKVEQVSNICARLALRAANRDAYLFQPPPTTLPTYADALVISGIYSTLNRNARRNALTPEQHAQTLAYELGLARIIKAGESRFTPNNAFQVGLAAVYALGLSKDLPFIP